MDDKILTFFCPTKLYIGINSHQKIEDIINDLGIKNIFIVVDKFLLETYLLNSVLEIIKKNGVDYELFTEIEPEPSTSTVESALSEMKRSKSSIVLAIGGGSTIDVGKAISILMTNGGRIHDYEGYEKFKTPPLPLIAIPTTAGTGSEVSGSCVITDTERGLKMSIRHPSLNPARIAIIDPIGLKTLPAATASHAALDAFVHAFESYISLLANPITDAINLYAIELMAQNIREYVANRGNLAAGLNMACGSTLAGMTFGLTGLGNVHCMARFVGALFHVSHGLSNAVCLQHVVKFNMLASPQKYARLAIALGENVYGLTQIDAARKTIIAIQKLCKDLGIPQRLREVGVTHESLPEMAKLAASAGYNKWNPRETNYDDFLTLFENAY